jgi:hypothetical protein
MARLSSISPLSTPPEVWDRDWTILQRVRRTFKRLVNDDRRAKTVRCFGTKAADLGMFSPRPLRAVRVVPITGLPLLVCPDQRTYSDTAQVENELRAVARICT